MKKFLSLFLLLLLTFPLMAHAKKTEAVRILEAIPVQHDGRVKPFQSFAQEAALYIIGRTTFEKTDASQLIFEWMASPGEWQTRPLIPVKHNEIQKEFGVMVINGRISPQIALEHKPFVDQIHLIAMKKKRKDPLTPLEKKKIEIYEKASFFEAISQGAAPGWVAHPELPNAAWLPMQSLSSEEGKQVLSHFFDGTSAEIAWKASLAILAEYREAKQRPVSAVTVKDFSDALAKMFESKSLPLDQKLINKEVHYLGFKPFQKAWIFYFLSFLMIILGSVFGANKESSVSKFLHIAGYLTFIAAILMHSYGFYLRCSIAGRPPVTNMYESMIWVSWAVAFVALILNVAYRSTFILNTASLVAASSLLIAQSFPVVLSPAISPLVPVLRSNLWLTIHVLTITMSYGAFLLAWGLGHGVLFHFAFHADKKEKLRYLSQFLYRTLQIGVVLLAAGTILGGVWANYSWGRFWGWDPKETWALIALLGYLAVLHSRFAGWVSDFGIAMGSCIAFLGVLMAWYGVNFVLGAGLHSYGSGGGGLMYVLIAIAIDGLILFVFAQMSKHRKSNPPKHPTFV
jgi:cytochrome c-type biogenesis protein CcsB